MSYDYYELLNLKKDATQEQIAEAYHNAQKIYSLENQSVKSIFTDEESETFLKYIGEAYGVLSQPEIKKLYDEKLKTFSPSSPELALEALIEAHRQHKEEEEKRLEATRFKRDEAFEKQILNYTQWNGDFLKKVREYKKLSVDQVYEITKINPWYVTAVEEMSPGDLPAPVFVRGYVVQLARLYGLNERIVAESYMGQFKALTAKRS